VLGHPGELVMGLTQLSGGLLLMLERATAMSGRKILQEFGLLYGAALPEAHA
jgi:hypothetical protein